MKKVLFFIHDLGPGGAEKVLVNLVNNMDRKKFDITVMALIGGGVNEQFLKPHIRYRACFKGLPRGHIHMLKLLSPRYLYNRLIGERYDIAVSYLEGPAARIVSGCPYEDTKLVSWIHVEQHTKRNGDQAFRNHCEAKKCYEKFHRTICVSEYVKQDFLSLYPDVAPVDVLYNTNETAQILHKKDETIENGIFKQGEIRICGVGKLNATKRFDMLLRIHKRLREQGYPLHTYLLGEGAKRDQLEQFIQEHQLNETVTFLGYQTNPYKYVANCDLFVCTSLAEGFSTAATEALIVGTPVCTVEVSGMKEMLGQNNEYGIVTENNEEALYQGIKSLLDDEALLAHYKKQAQLRGKDFHTEHTVSMVEQMLLRPEEAK